VGSGSGDCELDGRRKCQGEIGLQRFPHPLEDANPDIPILKKAKAEYAKLQ
jgi:hypothetical protein